MDGVDPGARGFVRELKRAGGVVVETFDQCADEEDLGEFTAGIQVRGTDVGVELLQRSEVVGRGQAVEFRGLENEAGILGFGQVREEDHGEVELREVVYLEVGVDAVGRFIVGADAFACVEDQGVDAGFGIEELVGNFVGLVEVLKIQLSPVDARSVTVFLETFDGFVGVFFLLGEEDDLGGIVLENVCSDSKSNAGGAARYNVDLDEGVRGE